jgi:hypothetical protein
MENCCGESRSNNLGFAIASAWAAPKMLPNHLVLDQRDHRRCPQAGGVGIGRQNGKRGDQRDIQSLESSCLHTSSYMYCLFHKKFRPERYKYLEHKFVAFISIFVKTSKICGFCINPAVSHYSETRFSKLRNVGSKPYRGSQKS